MSRHFTCDRETFEQVEKRVSLTRQSTQSSFGRSEYCLWNRELDSDERLSDHPLPVSSPLWHFSPAARFRTDESQVFPRPE
jgi:hypothetical protein